MTWRRGLVQLTSSVGRSLMAQQVDHCPGGEPGEPAYRLKFESFRACRYHADKISRPNWGAYSLNFDSHPVPCRSMASLSEKIFTLLMLLDHVPTISIVDGRPIAVFVTMTSATGTQITKAFCCKVATAQLMFNPVILYSALILHIVYCM